jgi:ATP-dependent Lon protease
MLDEIDKMSTDFRGDPSAALLEVLDPEQNWMFQDHYLDVEYDLSQVLFVATANVLHTIPVPLQDRMEIIRLAGYTELEKMEIAKRFLVPKQMTANGLKPEEAEFTDEGMQTLILNYTREAGVRNLEREVGNVFRKIARKVVTLRGPSFKDEETPVVAKKKGKKKQQPVEEVAPEVAAAAATGLPADLAIFPKVVLTSAQIAEMLGPLKFRELIHEKKAEIGQAVGLAWTEMGGTLLTTEATIMEGRGKLTLTGKLGDVMQESAQAALSYVRTRAQQLGLPRDFYRSVDIHVHVPEGAIPKDGPSAGITLATSITSALTKIPVRNDVAMTGEVTLRGKVLPIGGLKEKLLAAHRQGIFEAILPKDNEKDLAEVPENIRKDMKLHAVEWMDEVLKIALERELPNLAVPETPVLPVVEDRTTH